MKITVTTSATPVASNDARNPATADFGTRSYLVVCPAHTGTVYFENAADGTAATATGLPVDFSRVESMPFSLEAGESMNAVTASGSVELRVLRVGR